MRWQPIAEFVEREEQVVLLCTRRGHVEILDHVEGGKFYVPCDAEEYGPNNPIIVEPTHFFVVPPAPAELFVASGQRWGTSGHVMVAEFGPVRPNGYFSFRVWDGPHGPVAVRDFLLDCWPAGLTFRGNKGLDPVFVFRGDEVVGVVMPLQPRVVEEQAERAARIAAEQRS